MTTPRSVKQHRRLQHGLRLLDLCGPRNGKTLLVFGGVHGDEYEGQMAIARLFERLTPKCISGRIMMIPNCNPPACEAGTHCSPIDDKKLLFPGNPHGTPTERIAHRLTKLIRDSDFLIDLHGGGRDLASAPMSGYLRCGGQTEALQHEACVHFGLPIILGLRPPPTIGTPGPSLHPAYEFTIPAIYSEARGANVCCEEQIIACENGVLSVAAMLGIIPKHMAPDTPRPRRIIRESTRRKSYLNTLTACQYDGVWIFRRRVLQRVKRGEIIGEVRSLNGECLDTLCAPSSGQIILLRHSARVKKGDWLYCLA